MAQHAEAREVHLAAQRYAEPIHTAAVRYGDSLQHGVGDLTPAQRPVGLAPTAGESGVEVRRDCDEPVSRELLDDVAHAEVVSLRAAPTSPRLAVERATGAAVAVRAVGDEDDRGRVLWPWGTAMVPQSRIGMVLSLGISRGWGIP